MPPTPLLDRATTPDLRPEAAAPTATVSVVVPAYDESAVIERCLAALVAQTVLPHEIVVVDNRSTDGTDRVARSFAGRHPHVPIRVLEQSQVQGLVPTRDHGFAAATGDILGRVDADTVVDPDWVARVSEALTRPGAGAVTGPVSYYDVPFRRSPTRSDDLVRRLLRLMSGDYPFLYGSNMALRADAWSAVRGTVCHDPEDLLHEDIDLAVHLRRAGIEVAYEPTMRASVSARRLRSSARSFRDYTARFERTYAAHEIDRWALQASPVLLQGVYWWARAMRALQPGEAHGATA